MPSRRVGKEGGREGGGRTIVRHDQIDLRLLDRTLAEVGSNEATSVSRQGGLSPLVEALFLAGHPSRHEVQHSLQEMGQCVWDGTFLDHESVERVILDPAVDDPVYSRADGVVRGRELSADSVDDLVRVVSTTNPVSTGIMPEAKGGKDAGLVTLSRGQGICTRKEATHPNARMSPFPLMFWPTLSLILRPIALLRRRISVVPIDPAPRKTASLAYTHMRSPCRLALK